MISLLSGYFSGRLISSSANNLYVIIFCFAMCSDGSHRTIGCTASTTCGELLHQTLSKIGLEDEVDDYALKIKYKYAGKH